MYLVIEENPNCQMDERVFAAHGEIRTVQQVQLDRPKIGTVWCDVTGIGDSGAVVPVHAQRVDDSADGTAWLITGGAWGLRFRLMGSTTDWNLADTTQWSAPFMVLDKSGQNIRFKPE